MRRKRFLAWAIGGVMAVVAVGEWLVPGIALSWPTTLTEWRSRSEVVSGMQVAVKGIRRIDGRLRLNYTLRWVGLDRSFGFMRPWGSINVHFWDAAGNRLKHFEVILCTFDKSFREHRSACIEGEGDVEAPSEAECLSLEVGRSGIVTRKVAIPN